MKNKMHPCELRPYWVEDIRSDSNLETNKIPCYSSRRGHHRSEKKPIPDSQKDDKYYERRKKNNQAAKKSRDARRIREDFMALRMKFLENENGALRQKIILLRQEIESLRTIVLLETQRKIPGELDRNYWSENALSKILRGPQSCCSKHFDHQSAIITNPSSDINHSASVIALTSFISRLSSILQLPACTNFLHSNSL